MNEYEQRSPIPRARRSSLRRKMAASFLHGKQHSRDQSGIDRKCIQVKRWLLANRTPDVYWPRVNTEGRPRVRVMVQMGRNKGIARKGEVKERGTTLKLCLSLALILTAITGGYAQSTTPPVTAEPVAVVTPAPAPTLVLPINTPVKLALSQTLSSATSRTNDIINFYVLDDVIINKVVVIRRGATATGKVTYAKSKAMMGKAGKLEIAVSNVRLADNKVTVELSAVQRAKGDGHGVAVGVTTGVVALVFWPAAPFMLMRHGNDIQISAGTEVIAYTALDTSLPNFGE